MACHVGTLRALYSAKGLRLSRSYLLFYRQWFDKKRFRLPYPVDISILRLHTEEPCWAPVTRIPRGRPKKEMIRAGNVRGPQGLRQENIGIEENGAVLQHRSHNACGTCGEQDGHNAGTCRKPHI